MEIPSLLNHDTLPVRVDALGRVLLWCDRCQAEHLSIVLTVLTAETFKLLKQLQQAEEEVRRLREELTCHRPTATAP